MNVQLFKLPEHIYIDKKIVSSIFITIAFLIFGPRRYVLYLMNISFLPSFMSPYIGITFIFLFSLLIINVFLWLYFKIRNKRNPEPRGEWDI